MTCIAMSGTNDEDFPYHIALIADSVSGQLVESRHEKTLFCICENKGTDQLRGSCTAVLGLCSHYIYSTIFLLPKSENLKHLAIFCSRKAV